MNGDQPSDRSGFADEGSEADSVADEPDTPIEPRTPVRSSNRRSSYLLTTSSGRSLDLADPRSEDIELEDIARALSKICRFGAQALSYYSVAQHAVEVARRVPAELRLAALHHDSHEAFAGDLPVPLKLLIRAESAVYADVCARLDRAIGARLGIEAAAFEHPLIKQADEAVVSSRASCSWPTEALRSGVR